MCRLALFNGTSIKEMGIKNLKNFMDILEKSNGGHGNGFAIIRNGEVKYIDKGIDLSNREICTVLGFLEGSDKYPIESTDWLLYHTRIASRGSVKDSNCHPYYNTEVELKDIDFMLAMNGTESAFGALGKSRDITDTEVIYEIINSGLYKIESLTELAPRFIGLQDKKVFATNPSGYGGLEYREVDYLGDKSIIIASEFPDEFDNVKCLKKHTVWREGDEFKEEPVEQKTYNSYVNPYYNKLPNWNVEKEVAQEIIERVAITDKDIEEIQTYILETIESGFLDIDDIFDCIRYKWGEDFEYEGKDYTIDMVNKRIIFACDDSSKNDIVFTCSL